MIGGISGGGFNPASIFQTQNSPPDQDRNFIEQGDTDGDGALSETEFNSLLSEQQGENYSEEKAAEQFAEIDADGDGSISQTEDEEARANMQAFMQERMADMQGLMSMMSGAQKPPPPPPAENASDTDSDQTTTTQLDEIVQQFAQEIKSLLANLDADDDGTITEAETTEFASSVVNQIAGGPPPGPPVPPDLMSEADTDEDGALSQDEFNAALSNMDGSITDEKLASLFTTADADGDGIITQAELDAARPSAPDESIAMANEGLSNVQKTGAKLYELANELLNAYGETLEAETTIEV